MRYLKSINENILDENRIKYTTIGGEINVNGDVILSGRGLSELPKFGSVSGTFDISNNNFESFEFLPETAREYKIKNNPASIQGLLGDIIGMCSYDNDYNTPHGIVDELYELYTGFISSCVSNGVWGDGETNEDMMAELWSEAKLEAYSKIGNEFVENFPILLDSEDDEILSGYFNINIGEISSSDELIDKIMDNFASKDNSVRVNTFRIISELAKKGGGVKELFVQRGFEKAFKHLTRSDVSEKTIEVVLKLMSKKMNRSGEEVLADEQSDLYVFNGKFEFVEGDDGRYSKELSIERMLRINRFELNDNETVAMMKMRARFQEGVDTYIVWINKDVMEMFGGEGQKSWSNDDLPDYFKMSMVNSMQKL